MTIYTSTYQVRVSVQQYLYECEHFFPCLKLPKTLSEAAQTNAGVEHVNTYQVHQYLVIIRNTPLQVCLVPLPCLPCLDLGGRQMTKQNKTKRGQGEAATAAAAEQQQWQNVDVVTSTYSSIWYCH